MRCRRRPYHDWKNDRTRALARRETPAVRTHSARLRRVSGLASRNPAHVHAATLAHTQPYRYLASNGFHGRPRPNPRGDFIGNGPERWRLLSAERATRVLRLDFDEQGLDHFPNRNDR